MERCFILKDVMVLIHLSVDHAQTYGNMSQTCKFMASNARKHLVRRQRELKGILPPIFLKTYFPFLKKIDLNSYDEEKDPIIPIDEPELVVKETEQHVAHRGDLAVVEFLQPGKITLNGTGVDVEAGCYLIPQINLVFTSVYVQSAHRMQHLLIIDHDRRDTLIRLCLYQRFATENHFKYFNGACGLNHKIDGKQELFETKKRLERTGEYEIRVSAQCDNGAEPNQKTRDVVSAHKVIVNDLSGIITYCDEQVAEFAFAMMGARTSYTFMFRTTDKYAAKDILEPYFIDANIMEIKKDVTTVEEIDEQRVKQTAKRYKSLKELVNIGIIEPFE